MPRNLSVRSRISRACLPSSFPGKSRSCASQLAAAQRGEAFLLQGGDCAETFADCESDHLAKQLKVLLQMSLVLLQAMKRPVIRVGRFAGQYAKPRSADTETRNGVSLPAYRGDLVNRPEFSAEARRPDPQLLLRGYERAALTLNFIRALVDGGFADLHHPEYWDLGFMRDAPLREAYERIVHSIGDALDFFESLTGQRVSDANHVEFFASHEGLHLLYEQAQTRYIARQERWYNLSTHMPWIGMRTAQLDGAHVEYFRGIANPVGVKICAAMSDEWLQELVAVLNPNNQPGRLTLIHRFGVKEIEQHLPRVIEAVRRTGQTVLWTLRSHARQYRDHERWREDQALRKHHARARSLVSHPSREGFDTRWRTHRTDR